MRPVPVAPLLRGSHLGLAIALEGAFVASLTQIYWVFNNHQPEELLWRVPLASLAGAVLFLLLFVGSYARLARGEQTRNAVRAAGRIDAWSFAVIPVFVPLYFIETLSFPVAWTAWLAIAAIKSAALFRVASLAKAAWPRGLIVSGFAVVASLMLAEFGLRVWLGATQQSIEMLVEDEVNRDPNRKINFADMILRHENERIVYIGRPEAQGLLYGKYARMNAHGFRGPDIEEAKPDDVRRIVVLGDSYAFGLGAGQRECFPAKLQRKLNAGDRPVRYEVLNLGLPGYNTVQEVEVFKLLGLRFDPDIVVLQYFLNDLAPPYFLKARRRYMNERGSVMIQWMRRRLLNQGASGRRSLRKAAREKNLALNTETGLDQPFPGMHLVPEEYRYMAGWENFEKALAELSEISRRRNIPVAMFALAEAGKPVHDVERVEALARKHGLLFHDASAEMNAIIKAAGRPPSHFKLWGWDFHYSFEGNDMIAGIILRRLEGWGLVEPAAEARDGATPVSHEAGDGANVTDVEGVPTPPSSQNG